MNNKTNKINNSIFEALFRQAIIDDYVDEINSIPSNEELSIEYFFSSDFELRMKRLFARERRKSYLVTISGFFRQAAIIFIIITTILFGTLLTNSDVRATVRNVIIEWYEKFTSFSFNTANQDASYVDIYPKYLPMGFYEESIVEFGNFTQLIFVNNQGDHINILHNNHESTSIKISVDNENHIIENFMINGYETYLVTATKEEHENAIIITTGFYVIEIWSSLSIETLIIVAESIF